MEKKNILIAEDEPALVRSLTYCLQKEGYNVFSALNGDEALKYFKTEDIDLVLLDLMLPKISGEDVCKTIRQKSDIPIIMLTAKATETNKVIGFSIGADDYVTKPFSMRELMARIKAMLRRSKKESVDNKIIVAGPFQYQIKNHQIIFENSIINLPLKEYKLLSLLIKNRGKVLSREFLLQNIWGDHSNPKTLDVHINSLRKRIEKSASNPKYIQTVRGIGYSLRI